jgi:hypothetical protein
LFPQKRIHKCSFNRWRFSQPVLSLAAIARPSMLILASGQIDVAGCTPGIASTIRATRPSPLLMTTHRLVETAVRILFGLKRKLGKTGTIRLIVKVYGLQVSGLYPDETTGVKLCRLSGPEVPVSRKPKDPGRR